MPHRFTTRLLLTAALPLSLPAVTQADIYQWVYFDPNNPWIGVRESTTLAPDGAGRTAMDGIDWSGLDLTQAHLLRSNLEFANLTATTLTKAYLRESDLKNTDAADIELQQADLTRSSFLQADLKAADLSNAILISTNLSRTSLINANLTGTISSYARFDEADLTDANFTDATITGTSFRNSNLTKQQLYSTASYQHRDMRELILGTPSYFPPQPYQEDFSDWNLSNQSLMDAKLRHSSFTTTDFSSSDLRRAWLPDGGFNSLLNTQGAIATNGEINHFTITAGDARKIEDATYWGDGYIVGTEAPIIVQQSMSIAPQATLTLNAIDYDWASPITFSTQGGPVPVTLSGTLDIRTPDFPELNHGTPRISRFELFNWNNAAVTGWFDHVNIETKVFKDDLYDLFYLVRPDLTELASLGELRLNTIEIPHGDASLDQKVDLDDLLILAANFNTTNADWFTGDFNNDTTVNLVDLSILATHFGQTAIPPDTPRRTPEPALLTPLLLSVLTLRRRAA
ncbi:MAG: pentapeptide repeat-containing protein [Phycisphaeraceae bacterium]